MRKKNTFTNTLFDNQRMDEKKILWRFSQEIDMNFKPELDIVHQITEVLKTILHYFKLHTKDEIVEIIPKVLQTLQFPEETWPGEQWIRMQINYIRGMKKLNRYYVSKKTLSFKEGESE